ncbi:MAG TPA: DUF1376 domain-containing protein [Bryobacteraceae bacterium]|nr:DUF1376 domain-containing protein [Bryobacteraceae bacterium]
MRNAESVFRDFYTWYFKDWFISGARARLTLPQRAIYLDLLGFCYTEGGITPDKAVLLRRLGLGPEHDADLETALKEFEVHPDDDNRLMHPRMLVETKRLEAARKRRSNGGKARAGKPTKAPELSA